MLSIASMSPREFDDWLKSHVRRPLVMGVLNVTPDSFSDGGKYLDADTAVRHGLSMLEQGADLLDVGGESTRPGSMPVPADEQIRRVEPVIARLCRENPAILISIDTTQARVARAAIDAGARIVNDISGGTADPDILQVVEQHGVPAVLMHMQGTPQTMQLNPRYDDVVNEVKLALEAKRQAAVSAGIERWRIVLDPGIGFGKAVSHNLTLLRRLKELKSLGAPLLLGVSRKGFIGRIAGGADPDNRVFGTAAAVSWCLANGADIARVHDVDAMAQVTRLLWAIQTAGDAPP